MHRSLFKASRGGKPDAVSEDSCGARDRDPGPAQAQRPPAYALSQDAPALPLFGGAIQAKLAVSQPDDPFEQEADAVAQRFMDPAAGSTHDEADTHGSAGEEIMVRRKCEKCDGQPSQSKCTECGQEELQRKASAGGGPRAAARGEAEAGVATMRGGGRPLPADVRGPYESRLGHDFSRVRIHDDPGAARTARALDARAYTVGHDVAFAQGEYAPATQEGGRLLAHELTHVVQQGEGSSGQGGGLVQRQPTGGAQPGGSQAGGVQAGTDKDDDYFGSWGTDEEEIKQLLTLKPGTETLRFDGVLLADDRDFMRDQMRHLIATRGLGLLTGSGLWMAKLLLAADTSDYLLMADCQATALGKHGSLSMLIIEPDEATKKRLNESVRECYADTQKFKKLARLAFEVYAEVYQEAEQFLDDFDRRLKKNLETVLDAQEAQAKSEAVRYGIDLAKVDYGLWLTSALSTMKISVYTAKAGTDYQSPAMKGLHAAAKVLLERRIEIDERAHKLRGIAQRDPNPKLAHQYVDSADVGTLFEQYQARVNEYNSLRAQFTGAFPVLAAFTDLDADTKNLQKLVNAGPGPEMSGLIGGQVVEKLANINKVRLGMSNGDVNVWRLPSIIEPTELQFGAKSDAMKQRLIKDKVSDEQPGILEGIALLVLNIGAILLAPATGGLSLVAAAAVNVAVTVRDINEYFLKKAMTGTAFDKAQAISQEEPSLFWLALGIVGTVFDVKGAVSALNSFRRLAPLVKAAQVAAEGEEAARTLRIVREVAEEELGEGGAAKIIARVQAVRKGEATIFEGLSEAESKLFGRLGAETEAEAVAGIGEAVKTTAGEVSLSRAGHIFSCASPCTVLRDKYARFFAEDEDLLHELKRLEGEGDEIAKARTAAEAGDNADELAKVEPRADNLKQEAAALEKRILDENPHLLEAPTDDAYVNAVKEVEAEAAVADARRFTKNADELEKIKPDVAKPPAGVAPDDSLWTDYVDYFNGRLDELKAGKGVKPPLSWEAYSEFLGKFRRGTKYQDTVFKGMRKHPDLPDMPEAKPELFPNMADPVVESNVGVLEKSGKMSEAGRPVMNYPDQLVVDRATINHPFMKPRVQSFSNKSRVWPEKLGPAEIDSVSAQVVEDANEALAKYGGEITLRRPGGPLAPLYGKKVKVEKVTLIYDKAYVKTPDLEKIIRDAAAGVEINGQKVEVVFQ